MSKEKTSELAHELRMPITAILGYTNLLVEEFAGPAEQLEKLLIIRNHSEYLLKLVNHLLTTSEASLGFRTRDVDPVMLAADVVSLMQPALGSKPLTLSLELQGPLPQVIQSDEMRLRQILINLLGNALKFTNEGYVRLILKWQASEPVGLLLSVQDSGIGMNEQQIQRLFQPFVQVHLSSSHRTGTGLGLSTCMRLVRQLRGEVTVASQLGQGTTFTVRLPGAGVKAEELRPRSAPDSAPAGMLAGRDFLLSVTTGDIRLLVSSSLKHHEASITLVDGASVVRQAMAAVAGGRPFFAILLDARQGSATGLEQARSLRAAGYHGPVLGLGDDAGQQAAAQAAGMDAILELPLDIAHLLTVIATSDRIHED